MILKQYTDSYRYNSDTIFLYNFITRYNIKGSILDVGSGCGVLGLLIKRDFSNIKLTQIEIQEKYATLCAKNAKINNLDSEIINDDFLNSSFEEKFDFIISNPPFYHSGSLKSENSSLLLSRHSDSLVFEEFAKKAHKTLKPKGSFIFCYDAKQVDFLLKYLLEAKFKVNEIQFVHVNRQKSASLVNIHAKRESKSLCKILPPLILYQDGKHSTQVNEIYKKADTNSEDI
ncbi:MAG: methyltransferase [Sulfurospirillum sp.]